MIPEAPLALLRHPMVTRSAAWLCRLPTSNLVVSRRPTGGSAKSFAPDLRFSTHIDSPELPQSLLYHNPVTRYLQTRTGNDIIDIHTLNLHHYTSSMITGAYDEHRISQLNYTTPILDRIERQIHEVRRTRSLLNPRKRSLLEYVERPIQLWDTLTTGVKPMHNATQTITHLRETFARAVHGTFINIQGLNRAFQTATTTGLRGYISLTRAFSTDSWKIGTSDFQKRWIYSGPLVDEPGGIESCIIGSNMAISEITSLLSRRCCKNLSGLLPPRSCSAYPVSTGGFGDIYSGKLEDGTLVAIKVTRYLMNNAQFGKQSKHTAKELHTWAKCDHPNVLPLLGMLEFRDQIAMVSPWMKHGDLRSYLRKYPEADRCQLCYDICDGLVYLHSTNIVHGDLKGANVLISDSGKAMLSDFGNALIEDNSFRFTVTTRDTACSSRWAAPEILEGSAASYQADIFALGMTLLEAITGDVPYRELEREQAVMAAILFKRAIPARPTSYIPRNSPHGDHLWDLLTKCWAYEPVDRPDAAQVQDLMARITKMGLIQRL